MTDVSAPAEELPWDWIDRGWAERREYERKSIVMSASIETADGVFDCLTADLGFGGARLHLIESFDTAKPVVLILGDYGRFEARVAWRATAEIGLQFTVAADEVAQRLAGLL